MKTTRNFSAWCRLICLQCCLCLPLGACTNNHLITTTVSSLDLNRYLGNWYEIARFDHSFERNMEACTARYSLNDNGTIRVENSGIKNGRFKVSVGKAKTTDTTGLLRVSFFGPFYSDYRVLMLADDYHYALVGSSSDQYLWILARTPSLPGDELTAILNEARQRGYNTDRLIWVDQTMYQ